MRKSQAVAIVSSIIETFTRERICFEIDGRGVKKMYRGTEPRVRLVDASIIIWVYGVADCLKAAKLYPRRFTKNRWVLNQLNSSNYTIKYK